MRKWILHHGSAAFAAMVLVLIVAVPAAAKDPPHVVQTSAGDLYVVDGSKRYALQVHGISDSDLTALDIWDEIWAVVPVRPTQPVRIVVASDGTLYLAQNGSAWPLVPDSISDSALASLTSAGELDGLIPAATAPLANEAPPPQDLVGKWGMTQGTGAGNGSWVGDSYLFQKDGSFEHAGRFVFGVDMQQYETGTMVVSGSRMRLDARTCEIKRSQVQQYRPCILESQTFGWRVGNNELGYRVLTVTAFDGTRTELRPMAR